MRKFNFFIIVYCTMALACNAMENNLMIEIKTEDDIVPFVGKIVVYTTEYEPQFALKNCDYYCTSWACRRYRYGYIENKDQGNRRMESLLGHLLSKEETYRMFPDLDKDYMVHSLLRSNAFLDCSSFLHKGYFRNAFHMRNITKEEALEIEHLLQSKKVRFSSWDEKPPILPQILAYLKQIAEK